MLRESRTANAKAHEEIKELKATIKMQEEKLKQMKGTPLLALVEREKKRRGAKARGKARKKFKINPSGK
jgi:uncharacterized protein (DUF342 family)